MTISVPQCQSLPTRRPVEYHDASRGTEYGKPYRRVHVRKTATAPHSEGTVYNSLLSHDGAAMTCCNRCLCCATPTCRLPYQGEHVLDGARGHAGLLGSSHHGVRFSGPRVSVRENRGVVPSRYDIIRANNRIIASYIHQNYPRKKKTSKCFAARDGKKKRKKKDRSLFSRTKKSRPRETESGDKANKNIR